MVEGPLPRVKQAAQRRSATRGQSAPKDRARSEGAADALDRFVCSSTHSPPIDAGRDSEHEHEHENEYEHDHEYEKHRGITSLRHRLRGGRGFCASVPRVARRRYAACFTRGNGPPPPSGWKTPRSTPGPRTGGWHERGTAPYVFRRRHEVPFVASRPRGNAAGDRVYVLRRRHVVAFVGRRDRGTACWSRRPDRRTAH